MADAKSAADVSQAYTTLQGGDLFGVERSGVFGKFTWSNFQTQDMTMTGTIDFSGATVSGLAASAPPDAAYGDITVSGGVWTIDAGVVGTAELADDAVTAEKLANTAVTPGSYTAADITVDEQGRITDATNGTVSGGWTEVATQTLGSNSSTITQTGLSSYRSVRLHLSAENNASGQQILFEASPDGTTWRTLCTFTSITSGTNDYFAVFIDLLNFNDADNEGIMRGWGVLSSDINALDVSDAENSGVTSQQRVFSSYRSETWDRIRFRTSTGNMDANTSLLVEGMT